MSLKFLPKLCENKPWGETFKIEGLHNWVFICFVWKPLVGQRKVLMKGSYGLMQRDGLGA